MLCIYIKDTFILVEENRHRQKTKYTFKKLKRLRVLPGPTLLFWTIPFLLENWSHVHIKSDLSSHISEH